MIRSAVHSSSWAITEAGSSCGSPGGAERLGEPDDARQRAARVAIEINRALPTRDPPLKLRRRGTRIVDEKHAVGTVVVAQCRGMMNLTPGCCCVDHRASVVERVAGGMVEIKVAGQFGERFRGQRKRVLHGARRAHAGNAIVFRPVEIGREAIEANVRDGSGRREVDERGDQPGEGSVVFRVLARETVEQVPTDFDAGFGEPLQGLEVLEGGGAFVHTLEDGSDEGFDSQLGGCQARFDEGGDLMPGKVGLQLEGKRQAKVSLAEHGEQGGEVAVVEDIVGRGMRGELGGGRRDGQVRRGCAGDSCCGRRARCRSVRRTRSGVSGPTNIHAKSRRGARGRFRSECAARKAGKVVVEVGIGEFIETFDQKRRQRRGAAHRRRMGRPTRVAPGRRRPAAKVAVNRRRSARPGPKRCGRPRRGRRSRLRESGALTRGPSARGTLRRRRRRRHWGEAALPGGARQSEASVCWNVAVKPTTA